MIQGVGPLLKDWRRRRHLSQLDLALEAGISTRHLSFVETGRARPSAEMVLHLAPPVNVLRLSLHPEGIAPRIANLAEWRAHLLDRLGREAVTSGDPALAALHEELAGYPCDEPAHAPDLEAGAIAVPLRLRHDGGELSFISTVTTFGTALDVTVSELSIESFFPADEATAAFLRL